VLAVDGAALSKAFPSWEQRRRFLRYLVGRYAAMNVTWQGVEYFEDSVDTRALQGGRQGAKGTGWLSASTHCGGARDLGAAARRRLDGLRRLRQHGRPNRR